MSDDDTSVSGGDDGTGAANLESQKPELKFSQEDVDRLITERLSRERKKFERTAAEQADQIRVASLSEQEQAIEKAKAEARAEVQREAALHVAAAEIRAVLTGLVDDPAAIIEDLNLSRFLDEDNQVDAEAVKRLKSKYESLLETKKRKPGSVQAGRTSQTKTSGGAKEDFLSWRATLN